MIVEKQDHVKIIEVGAEHTVGLPVEMIDIPTSLVPDSLRITRHAWSKNNQAVDIPFWKIRMGQGEGSIVFVFEQLEIAEKYFKYFLMVKTTAKYTTDIKKIQEIFPEIFL